MLRKQNLRGIYRSRDVISCKNAFHVAQRYIRTGKLSLDFLAIVSSGIHSFLLTSAKKVALFSDINLPKPLSVKALIFNQPALIIRT